MATGAALGGQATDAQTSGQARHVRIMGADVAAVTEAEAVRTIVDAASAERDHWTITVNLVHLRSYSIDAAARELIQEADLIVADGAPLVWASMLAGTPLPERIAGSNMIWSISEAASCRDLSVFLLGGNPGVADRAAQVLQETYPGLQVAGTLCPPFGFESDTDVLRHIRRQVVDAAPRIVFVGLPFPKQELLIRHLRGALPHTSFIGLGASFSFVAGESSRAPRWTHSLGLEWFYRLLQEPRRLSRRYLIEGAPFALRLLTSATWQRLPLHISGKANWGWDGEPPVIP
jgi:N-acetylglucosaminyldiphosphoundecaprenol N-acetyl-beta-D-mannosaminyltransferase